MKKRIIFIKTVSFSIIFLVLFWGVNEVLKRKRINEPMNFSVKTGGFYNLEENSLDYMAFGTSHCYCSINPLEVWQNTGLKGYLFTSQQQPVKATYYYVKEALKTQKPKVVILECFMMKENITEPDDSVIRDACEFLRPSVNKFQLIKSLAPKENSMEYYISFLKYHSRWKEVTRQDFSQKYKKEVDSFRGYVFLDKVEEPGQYTVPNTKEQAKIAEENLEYFNKIKALLDENDIELILYYAPFQANENNIKVVNSLKEIAEENNITFINGFDNYDNLDFSVDFYDKGHLNFRGAKKETKRLSDVLKSKLGEKERSDLDWNRAFDEYEKRVDSCSN